ncbi:MAG: LPS assembly lipoprotein LptE [Candidatus Poribacteria bacterium]|nr:LPS assembly lipoprotein LptE [Candidatus Poribacteria bacterium]
MSENKQSFISQCVLITALLILPNFIFGCGYVSTSSYLEHIKTVNIPLISIEDPDFSYDADSGTTYDEIITEQLRDRFNQKWRDGNDAQLDMVILDYDLEPIQYDVNNNPSQFRMSLQIEYEFRDRVQNRIIDRQENYIQVHDFYITSVTGEEPETRQEATTRLIRELTDDLYNQLAEQW